MASMRFQDVYSYPLDRVPRCVVHYAAPDGRVYPFCSYTSGLYHRRRVEKRFDIPADEYHCWCQARGATRHVSCDLLRLRGR